MASKENLYQIGKNLGRLAAAGAALYGGIYVMENRGRAQDSNQSAVVQGQVLTDAEIAQLRNYETLKAVTSKVEPTATATLVSGPTPIPPSLEPAQKMEMMSVAPATAEQSQLIERYKEEIPDILKKLNADQQQVGDLTTYFPIYRIAQDKTGVPWYLTWIVHEQESTASRNPSAFSVGSPHYGAMGRAVQFHPESDVERASKDYGFLADLPQRHFDDWQEIIWGATALSEYIKAAGSVPGGLGRYSAAGPAQERYVEYEKYRAIFGN